MFKVVAQPSGCLDCDKKENNRNCMKRGPEGGCVKVAEGAPCAQVHYLFLDFSSGLGSVQIRDKLAVPSFLGGMGTQA